MSNLEVENKNDSLKNLINFLNLENTKILYEGINKLYDIYNVEKQLNPNLSIEEFVSKEYDECRKDNDQTHYFYSQNINHDFFLFIYYLIKKNIKNKSLDTDGKSEILNENGCNIKKIIVDLITKYLTFCVDINNALYNDGNQTVFYSYSNIANDIYEIFNYEFCFLVYSDNTGDKILDTSDFQKRINLDITDKAEEIYKIVNYHKSQRLKTKSILSETIICSDENPQEIPTNYDYISLCIDLPRKKFENNLKSVYIIILKNKNDNDESQIKKGSMNKNNEIKETDTLINSYNSAAFVLSFKYKLQTLFRRDSSSLLSLNYNNSFDDIEKLSKSDEIHILHITDLHVNAKNVNEIIKSVHNQIFKTPDNDSVFDLMIITGDVAQGNCSAGELEENYEHARHVIEEIARNIWSNSNGKLRSDWKKRIIITTGNHDYASMNELYAVESNRKLQYGQVATKEGSTMVKFAYFINFIRKLQNIPLGTYIDDGLNEIRTYKKLNLTVCSLNSCSRANPLRTNKVRLNAEWINRVKKSSDNINCICAVHHVPEYEINYFIDKLDIHWNEFKSQTDKYEAIEALKYIGNFLGNIELNKAKLKLDLEALDKRNYSTVEKETKIFKECLDKLKKYDKAVDQELYDKINTYIDKSDDEYTTNWKKEIETDELLSTEDKATYTEQYTKLKSKFEFKITLGGHEHTFYAKPKYSIYAGDKFYKDKKIHYGVVTLKDFDHVSKEFKKVEYSSK